MSDEYRDPLGAAHARISELEEKVAVLEAEKAAPTYASGRFPELETRIAALKLRTDEQFNTKRRLWLTWVGIVFPLLGAVFSFAHLPIYATVCSVIFIALTLLNLNNMRRLKIDKVKLSEAEKELADKHRIVELETKLAETQARVRVGAEPEAEPISERADEQERTALRS